MQNINSALQANHARVANLLQKYKVPGGVNMATIKRAHDKYGENFMMKLLGIIVPNESNFTSLLQPTEAYVTSSSPLDTKTLGMVNTSAQYEQMVSSAQTKGKFWQFWENLLGNVGYTGEAIGKWKYDVNAPDYSYNLQMMDAANRAKSRTILTIAGLLAVLLVVVLIMSKK